jgi:hypothetical protein
VSTIERLLTAVTVLALAWGVGIAVTGGGRFWLLDATITATDPFRPFAVAAVLFLLRMVLGGIAGFRRDLRDFFHACTPSVQRWIFIAAIVVIGVSNASSVASGSDSYGYISQADLWLKRELITHQPGAARVPWPNGQETFSPLGYAPTPSQDGIVPTYAPGLPLVMAAFKVSAGQCASRWIAPLAAGVLVAMTFAIARQAVSAPVAAAASWLLVTSPVFLYLLPLPMSDMPAAALWSLAIYGCMIGTRFGALAAGLAAGAATLIRPNLIFVGCAMGCWLVARDWRLAQVRSRVERAVLFFVPLVVSCVAIAAVNTRLFGSPMSSGYGRGELLFRLAHLPANLFNYGLALVTTHTPLALLGVLALWIPITRAMGKATSIRDKSLLSIVAAMVVVSYLFYVPLDAWWYLRFLLPCWPAMCVGAAYLVTSRSGNDFEKIGVLMLLGVGLYGLWFARYATVFEASRTADRYVNVARAVSQVTEPDSVIISLQHSGSVRYYGERMTLRYEALDAQWLDRAIEWLRDNGVHPYILLDDAEHQPFIEKFGPANVAGKLDLAVVLEYRNRYRMSTFLYDPLQTSKLSRQPLIVAAPGVQRHRACVAPQPLPHVFPLR